MTQLAGVPPVTTGFNPADEEVQRDPYPFYHWLLRHDPVHRGAQGIWYVSRYHDVRTVMGEPRFERGGIRDFWASLVGPGPLSEILRHTIFFQDPPDHDRLRALIAPAFSPRVVRALRPTIARIVDDILAPVLPRGEMEVVNDLAYPVALTVIAHVLGLPEEDRDRLRTWSLAIAPTLDLAATPDEVAEGQTAMGEFVDYLRALIADGGGHEGDGLLGVMLAPAEGPDGVDEIISTAITLVFAGHDTVTNQIGNGLLALLRHPEQLEQLRRQPQLMAGAVEEFLRYDSSVQSNYRQLGEDIDIDGRPLQRGDLVVGLLGAANRDPARFEDPDRFDITRTDVQPMSFGAGLRLCLGLLLARLELAAVFSRVVTLADIRLAIPEQDLVYRRSTMFRGLTRLPITFSHS